MRDKNRAQDKAGHQVHDIEQRRDHRVKVIEPNESWSEVHDHKVICQQEIKQPNVAHKAYEERVQEVREVSLKTNLVKNGHYLNENSKVDHLLWSSEQNHKDNQTKLEVSFACWETSFSLEAFQDDTA